MAATTFHLPKSSNQQQNDLAAERDRSQRSVFVGNIPYEATDENLREIFSQAGPVLSFRLVYDRESGKPKGYGFCEYKDIETAQSAMRNLNGVELHGRNLRVDSAASEKGKEESKEVKPEASPYGAEMAPKEAPEAISQAVASLPPEQMFELMKQMKICIQNNPDEARQMLLQNPQLAYALLQAQVIMKIVDPKVAHAILHQPRGEALPTGSKPPSSGPSGMIPSSSVSVSGAGAVPVSSGPGPMMGMNIGPGGRSRGPDISPAVVHSEGWRPPDDARPDVDMPDMIKREFRGPGPMDVRGLPIPEHRGPPISEMLDPRDYRGPPMDRDEMHGREARGALPENEFRDFRDERFREFGGPGVPPFEMRDRDMREHGGPGMERGPIDPRAGPPGMEPRDPRMRGDMRGPSDQRGPSGGRGPPDGRVPGDLRPPPDARDGWVPPDRRGGGSDPRSSPRGIDERMIRDGRGPPPEIREPREQQLDPRAQAGPRGDARRGGPSFERWGGPPDPRGIPPEHRGPPGERRGIPPDGRGPPPDRRGPPPEQRNDPRFRSGPPGPALEPDKFFEGRGNGQGTPNAAEGPPRGPNGAKPTGVREDNPPFQQW